MAREPPEKTFPDPPVNAPPPKMDYAKAIGVDDAEALLRPEPRAPTDAFGTPSESTLPDSDVLKARAESSEEELRTFGAADCLTTRTGETDAERLDNVPVQLEPRRMTPAHEAPPRAAPSGIPFPELTVPSEPRHAAKPALVPVSSGRSGRLGPFCGSGPLWAVVSAVGLALVSGFSVGFFLRPAGERATKVAPPEVRPTFERQAPLALPEVHVPTALAKRDPPVEPAALEAPSPRPEPPSPAVFPASTPTRTRVARGEKRRLDPPRGSGEARIASLRRKFSRLGLGPEDLGALDAHGALRSCLMEACSSGGLQKVSEAEEVLSSAERDVGLARVRSSRLKAELMARSTGLPLERIRALEGSYFALRDLLGKFPGSADRFWPLARELDTQLKNASATP